MAIKVSQTTIDKIKAMGMTKALKGASGASPEMKEALTRMYGARRVAASIKDAPKSTSTGGYPKPAANKGTPMRPVMPGKGPAARVTSSTKKSGTTDPLAKLVFSAGRAISNNGAGTSTRKPVAGKPSVGEKISAALSGKGVGNRTTTTSVAATNAKRLGISVAEYNKRLNAKKAK